MQELKVQLRGGQTVAVTFNAEKADVSAAEVVSLVAKNKA